MTVARPEASDLFDRVQEFVSASQHGEVTLAQLAEFELLLRENEEARHLYVEFIKMSVCLPRALTGTHRAYGNSDASVDDGVAGNTTIPSVGSIGVPPPIDPHRSSSCPPSLSVPLHHVSGYSVSSGWPAAYLIATVVVAIGLAIGALVRVSRQEQYVVPHDSGGIPTASPRAPGSSTIVGRITGMVDCRWAEAGTEAVSGAYVPIGRRYALSSGLMEITYDSGARVMLQGPVTYEAESAAGGYLSLGKLTARLEKTEIGGRRSEVKDQRSEIRGQRSELVSQKSEVTSRKSFAIRTPTITATDLGTEFSVDVQRGGAVEVCVIEGCVETTRHGQKGGPSGKERIVAGEALRFTTADALPERIPIRPTSRVADMWSTMSTARHAAPLRASKVVATPFVGLLYDRRVRIDRTKLCLGRPLDDAGRTMAPRIFILKDPVDTDQTPPEADPVHWRELPLDRLYGELSGDRRKADEGDTLEFLLTGCSEEDRTGYGWAVRGLPGGGSAGDVSVSRMLAFGVNVAKPSTGLGVTRDSMIANYQWDWNDVSHLGGWRYLVNTNGPVGNDANYVELVWNSQRNWYSASPTAWPVSGVAGTVYMYKNPTFPNQCTACPGQGLRNQPPRGNAFPGYAIASYEVQPGQEGVGRISNSFLMLRDWKAPNEAGVVLSDGVDLIVYVNNTPIKSMRIDEMRKVDFNCDLGTLMAGDRVYVALGPGIGPEKADYFDGTDIAYQIDAAPVREPPTNVLFGVAPGLPRISPTKAVTE